MEQMPYLVENWLIQTQYITLHMLPPKTYAESCHSKRAFLPRGWNLKLKIKLSHM